MSSVDSVYLLFMYSYVSVLRHTNLLVRGFFLGFFADFVCISVILLGDNYVETE